MLKTNSIRGRIETSGLDLKLLGVYQRGLGLQIKTYCWGQVHMIIITNTMIHASKYVIIINPLNLSHKCTNQARI